MKKSSKIWKIVKYGHQFYEGEYLTSGVGSFAEDCQFIFNTELDCLLDIVTEPDNQGLKVYKHQTVTTEEPFGDVVEYAAIRLLPRKPWTYDYYHHSKEHISNLPEGSYEFLSDDPTYHKSQKKTVYHWVEAFMQ